MDFSKTRLMGILNLTPDSFSDGGCFSEPQAAVAHAVRLLAEGADVLDIGAESTRPGASPVSCKEELERILPVLSEIRKKTDAPVSIDTTKPAVARRCLELGADIINDVSGLRDSGSEMAEAVKHYGAGLILMHRRGTPVSMQGLAQYADVVSEVAAELSGSVALALVAGIERDCLAVDPGLGFSKTAEQNLEILKHLDAFLNLGFPVVLGHSRKSFIGEWTGRDARERGYGAAAVSAAAVCAGIHLLRIHDVAATRDVACVAEKLRGECHVGTF
ncbi:MAG: dihydropteroate synthase [Candidatus Omnitrophota bacterium]